MPRIISSANAVVGFRELQGLFLGRQLLSRPAAAQGANQRYSALDLAHSYLDFAELRSERLYLGNRDTQVIVEPVFVQHGRDRQRLSGLLTGTVLVRALRCQTLGLAQPVFHFLEGRQYRRTITIARLRVLRP